MLAAVGLLGIWLGLISNRANRQRRAVETIRQSGGELYYDYQLKDWRETECVSLYRLNDEVIQPDAPPPGPGWLRNLIGIDYLASVAIIFADKDIESVANEVEDLPQLRVVFLRGKQVTDSTLVHLRSLSRLSVLVIGDSSVSDAGWGALEHLTHLQTLALESCQNVRGAALSHVKTLTRLTELTLFRTDVTDAGLEQLGGHSRLEVLVLDKCPRITDVGLRHLSSLTHLRHLDVSGTGATQAGVQYLRQMIPKLLIDGP